MDITEEPIVLVNGNRRRGMVSWNRRSNWKSITFSILYSESRETPRFFWWGRHPCARIEAIFATASSRVSGGGRLVGIRSSFTARCGPGNIVDTREPQLPSGGAGVRPTPHEGDVAGTDNGLPSHVHGRCLVSRRTPVFRLPVEAYRHRLGIAEMRAPETNRAFKQAGAKNGEPESKSQGRCPQPPWLHAGCRLKIANQSMGKHVGGNATPSKAARYEKTPKARK